VPPLAVAGHGRPFHRAAGPGNLGNFDYFWQSRFILYTWAVHIFGSGRLAKEVRMVMRVFCVLAIHCMLSAAALGNFNLNDYFYTGQSLNISAETSNARATTWRADGSMIYVVGRGTENVVAYGLSTPWDLSTATYHSQLSIGAQMGSATQTASAAHGLYMRDDGQAMWVFNRTEIWGYTLSTPWDVTSASSTSYIDVSSFVQRGHDIDFKPDGTRLFIDDRDGQSVYAMNLSTPWDVTTATHVATLDISAQEQEVRGIELTTDGAIMLLLDTARREVLRYDLAVPYDILTALYVNAFDVSPQTLNPRGLSVNPNTGAFFVTGTDTQVIYTYMIPEPATLALLGAASALLLARRRRAA